MDETMECVIKTFLLQLNDSDLGDFEEQFTCLYLHHHPNIVPIYDMSFHSTPGAPGTWKLDLFMHYCDQGSLDQLILLHAVRTRTDVHACRRQQAPACPLLSFLGRLRRSESDECIHGICPGKDDCILGCFNIRFSLRCFAPLWNRCVCTRLLGVIPVVLWSCGYCRQI